MPRIRPPLRKNSARRTFVDGIVGVLHDVALVIHDPAVRNPLLKAQPEGLPHVHAGRFDATPLAGAQLFPKESVQGLLLAFSAEPQRLAGFQVARHRQELLLFAYMDLIHAHLPQGRIAPGGAPALQIPQVDCAHRALRPPESPRHLPRRRTLARLAHNLFAPLAERRFARQLLDLLCLDSAVRTADPVQLDHHRRTVLKARQIAHLAFIDLVEFTHPAPTTGAHQLPVPRLPPHPKFQGLGLLVDLVLITL